MKTEITKTEDISLGMIIFVVGVIISGAIYFGLSNKQTILKEESIKIYLPMPPCEPWDGGDYWCRPYVEWGYANGIVMAKRALQEASFIVAINDYVSEKERIAIDPESREHFEKANCEEIVDELYQQGLSIISGDYPFRTRR